MVSLPTNITELTAADKARFGADGYYLIHNHPSGKATPSTSDIALTQHLASQVFHPTSMQDLINRPNETRIIC